jgi:hypothetical protein
LIFMCPVTGEMDDWIFSKTMSRILLKCMFFCSRGYSPKHCF